MNNPQVEVLREADVVVARIEGDIDLANAPGISATILTSVPNDVLGLIVDLAEVRYIDSAGISMLFEFVRQLSACRQDLCIALPEESPVRTLVKITHLDEATIFCPSVEECAESLRSGGAAEGCG